MRMAKPLECSALHLIHKAIGAVVFNNLRAKPLFDPEVIRLEFHLVAQFKPARRWGLYDSLLGLRSARRVRVYIPFGREWFPYFMRRLGERPANVAFP